MLGTLLVKSVLSSMFLKNFDSYIFLLIDEKL